MLPVVVSATIRRPDLASCSTSTDTAPVNEVGLVLDLPAGTVKWRLSRARELRKTKTAELASSGALCEFTVRDLDRGANSLQEVLERDAPPED